MNIWAFAQGLWPLNRRDLYRATPVVTRGLSVCSLIRRTVLNFVSFRDLFVFTNLRVPLSSYIVLAMKKNNKQTNKQTKKTTKTLLNNS